MQPIPIVLMLALAAVQAAAQAAPDGKSVADSYFSGKDLVLTRQEKDAIAIAQRWRTGSGTGMQPVPGEDGAIRFLFGAQQPGIVCAVL